MSHLHVIIQVLISTSCMLNFSQQEMFLGLTSPAGNAPGGGWSGWAHPYSAFSPVPRSLGWLSETVPSLPLFPPISAQPLMTTFLLSTPPPPPQLLLPPQTLEMDGGFLVRTRESSKPIQHPWKCNHFWEWYSCLMGLLGRALGAPPPVCPLLTKRTGLGFPLPSTSKSCLWT